MHPPAKLQHRHKYPQDPASMCGTYRLESLYIDWYRHFLRTQQHPSQISKSAPIQHMSLLASKSGSMAQERITSAAGTFPTINFRPPRSKSFLLYPPLPHLVMLGLAITKQLNACIVTIAYRLIYSIIPYLAIRHLVYILIKSYTP
jgi:hypothetical protein